VTNRSASQTPFNIRSEERGPHWIAWLAGDDDGKPVNAVVLVGETRQEAEARALEYARQMAARART
jgi:hypothetical protein